MGRITRFYKNKKAIINPKNPIIDGKEVESDEQCFKWAVTIGSIWEKGKKNMERVNSSLIKESEKFNWSNVSFPVKVGKDIINFEKNNPEYGISVISFDFDEEKEIFVPLKVVKESSDIKMIDLLLYKNHYSYITSLSRLLGKGFSKKKVKKFICRNCFIHSSSEESYMKHQKLCFENGECVVKLPTKGDELTCKFKNFRAKFKSDFVIYADFEAYVSKKDEFPSGNENQESFTINTQKHTPCSFSYLVKCRENKICKPKFFSYTQKFPGEDIVKIFNERMDIERKFIYNNFTSKPKDMIFSVEDEISFIKQKECHICEGENISKYMCKPRCLEWVRDHDHVNW